MVPEITKILIVDDDPFVRIMLGEILESGNYIVETAQNGQDALQKYSTLDDIDLIISDMNMAVMDGLEFIKELRRFDNDVPIVILTVNDEISVALEAIRSGATDYLIKDENIQDTILVSVAKVLEKHILKQQNRQLLQDLAEKNNELKQSNEKLRELNELKNRFLGIAAHDLRGPIGGIKGLIELLMNDLEELLTPSQMKKLELIQMTSNDMLVLLNDLLDISMIESGKLELELDSRSLRQLIENRIQINAPLADKKKIQLHTHLGDVPEFQFDNKRISQVFDNLISNALKYSPMDSNVYITLKQENEMASVSIQDEGPGISEKDRERLFVEFQRLSAKPTCGEASTGLGLAISKKIIDAHGGVLEVEENHTGKGAKFTFKLPLADGVQ